MTCIYSAAWSKDRGAIQCDELNLDKCTDCGWNPTSKRGIQCALIREKTGGYLNIAGVDPLARLAEMEANDE